jgi:ubiquinone/menaquinone biosynthesis C-methylase UbiE
MAGSLEFDDAASRYVEKVYATPDVVAQRRVTRAALALKPGERVLDLACGPGYLSAEMAEEVGSEGRVHAVDVSESMLALARGRERSDRAAPIEFGIADATSLPFEDGSFDAITCTQAYEYVAEIETALAEAHRVLVPGGRLLILDTDWDSIVWRTSDDERTRRILRAWDEPLAHPYLPRHLPQLLRDAGFELAHSEVVALLNVGYDENTYSGPIAGMIARFVAGRQGITEDEANSWADDIKSMGDNYFFSLNRYLFVATR